MNNKKFYNKLIFNLKLLYSESEINCLENFLNILTCNKIKHYIVGGFTRDVLSFKKTTDLDIAINNDITDVLNIFTEFKLNKSGIKMFSLSFKYEFFQVNITSLRKDIITDGRKAKVERVFELEQDYYRRDFSINAIYFDYNSCEIFDFCNGIDDLKNKKLIFIGDPYKRICEDYLRILRYFRFLCDFDSFIDKKVLNMIDELKDNLRYLNNFKLQEEFKKIVLKNNKDVLNIIKAMQIDKIIGCSI